MARSKKKKTELLIKYGLVGLLFLFLIFQEIMIIRILRKCKLLESKISAYYVEYSNNEILSKQKLADIEGKVDNTISLLDEYNVKVDGQFIKTSKMEKHYSNLLKEEKKKRVDSSGLDLDLQRIEKEGKDAFLSKKYQLAYSKYSKLLDFNSSDLNARFYKMLSLFNINKSDSSKYKEILGDCKILNENGFQKERVEEIETFIKQEL